MGEALGGMGEAMGGVKEHADGLVETLSTMTKGWTGLLDVLGAGAVAELMMHIAETTMEVGDAMRQTGAMLNINASDARGFNEAMQSLGVASNAATQAIRRIEMDSASGGKQLERLGIIRGFHLRKQLFKPTFYQYTASLFIEPDIEVDTVGPPVNVTLLA